MARERFTPKAVSNRMKVCDCPCIADKVQCVSRPRHKDADLLYARR